MLTNKFTNPDKGASAIMTAILRFKHHKGQQSRAASQPGFQLNHQGSAVIGVGLCWPEVVNSAHLEIAAEPPRRVLRTNIIANVRFSVTQHQLLIGSP